MHAGGRAVAVVIAVFGALAALLPSAAVGAVRRGDAADGTRFFLNGKRLGVRFPATMRTGSRVTLACGSEELGQRRVASARLAYQGKRRVLVRLRRDVSKTAEWCMFGSFANDVDVSTLPSSAAPLRPLRRRSPSPILPGPGVRQAVTTDTDGPAFGGYAGDSGDATFLLRGPVLTVRLRRGDNHATVVRLICIAGEVPGKGVLLGYRALAVRARQHVITTDLGRDVASRATSCLIEGTGSQHSGDIAAAEFR